MTLEDLFHWYFGNQTEGAKEANTLGTERLHSRHLLRLLGTGRTLSSIKGQDLQEGYVNRRAVEKWHKKPIRPETIKKEIDTLAMIWRRAAKVGLVETQPPTSGFTYPKGREKRPFQTWSEL